jgi:hypothetical protein
MLPSQKRWLIQDFLADWAEISEAVYLAGDLGAADYDWIPNHTVVTVEIAQWAILLYNAVADVAIF